MKALPLFSLLNQNPMMYFVSLHMFLINEGNGYIYKETKLRSTFTLPVNMVVKWLLHDGNAQLVR